MKAQLEPRPEQAFKLMTTPASTTDQRVNNAKAHALLHEEAGLPPPGNPLPKGSSCSGFGCKK